MEPEILFEGSGAELAAQVEKFRHHRYLRIVAVPEPNHRARLPKDVVWENGIPIVPRRGNNEPVTMEQIKEWLAED